MAFLSDIKKRTDLKVRGVSAEQDDRDPITVSDTPWITELDPKRFAELPAGGKWMLFYSNNEITSHWRKCQHLYRNNQLEGVSNMKISTVHSYHTGGTGVIILYCGPPSDEARCKKIGNVILSETGYTNCSHQMFYKTDAQTLSKGSHKYVLSIPDSNSNSNGNTTRQSSNDEDEDRKEQNQIQQIINTESVAPIPSSITSISSAPAPIPIGSMTDPLNPSQGTMSFSSSVAITAPIPAPLPIPCGTASTVSSSFSSPIVPAPIPTDSVEIPAHGGSLDFKRIVALMSGLGFKRIVMIRRSDFEMMASSNTRLDSAKIWRQRIEQQSALNGLQKLVVYRWYRIEMEGKHGFDAKWNLSEPVVNLITLHYLENIDDKEQLNGDWTDNYKPCFYFFQEKFNILLRESGADEGSQGQQSLVCLKGRNECLIAKQFSQFWVICKVRVMGRRQMSKRNVRGRFEYASAPHAYATLQAEVFDSGRFSKII